MRPTLVLTFVLGFCPASGLAQTPAPNAIDDTAQAGALQYTVQGTVLDPTGAPITTARVAVVPSAPGAPGSTQTDAQGRFVLALGPGAFTLTISAPGFADEVRALRAEQAASLPREFVLQVAGVRETVKVGGTAPYQTPATTSATKTSTLLRDIPQSVSVVTSTLIAEQRMQSMGDVVRYMPGVGMAQGEGNRDTPILRGNTSTSDFFVDGVRDDVQYFRDVYNVDRVEALKGPNAMVFGRGGVGGVINRVTRQAGWGQSREVALQFGSFDNRRMTADLGTDFNDKIAGRITGVYENSDSYRDGAGLERYGFNPTVAFVLGPNTTLRAGYEHFYDDRVADRGISSFNGLPVETDQSTFFGDPTRSDVNVTVNVFSALLEHRFGGGVLFRNRTSYGDYDKFYQNVFPGAVNAAGTTVSISAYNNATERQNFFNQADVIVSKSTGSLEHTILAGVELGRQDTVNLRNTGYFTTIGPNVTTVSAPLSSPTISLPLDFRQSATDADNDGVATVAAIYAQDQVALTSEVHAVVGLRYDSFEVDVHNNRTATDFTSHDGLVSPRLGVIYKPIVPVSIYGSYSLSYLPRAGEQLSSLSLTNQSLDPETFRNYELGAKWDVLPVLSLTTAVYQLDRGNVAVPDPGDPTRSILVDAQRTRGVEIGLSGNVTRSWSLIGGYAFQDGEITQSISATAPAGAELAQLPKHSFSLWNKYDITPRWGVGLGIIHRSDMFASTDNLVTLPGYTRFDGGLFLNVTPNLRAQLNVENLFDEDYHLSAHSNTNITPGSPRALRVTLSTRF
jgi:catecholate siderophore receptor